MKDLEFKVEELEHEKEYFRGLNNATDSLQIFYYLINENSTAKSFNHGEMLISNSYFTLTIKGGSVMTDNLKHLINKEIDINSGDKLFISSHGIIWGVNVLDASNQKSHEIKLEIYKEMK